MLLKSAAVVAAFCFSVFAAAADPLLRCEAPDGHVTYTQGSCPDGTKLTQVRVVTPERHVQPARTWESEAARQRQALRHDSVDTPQRYDDSPYGWRRPKDRSQQRDQCEAVRERIAYERDLAGNNRTFDQTRDWQDREHRACKGL